MRRRKIRKSISSESSDEEPLAKKTGKMKKVIKKTGNDESSSESDIENYLQPAHKIDLNSSFFVDFQKNKSQVKNGTDKLGDSGSPREAVPSDLKSNFQQLHEYTKYTKELEEARKHVEEYKARKRAEENKEDVSNLLAAGESKLNEDKQALLADLGVPLYSSDFESCSDSEKEGWEEVEEEQKSKNVVPTEGLQITVEMPGAVKKKKGTELFASIKRRINHIRKKNQILIHKVHLLCWIAHGNYINSVINSTSILSAALSLLPSKQCPPKNRINLNHLKGILKWYEKTIADVDKAVPFNTSLEKLLEAQITKKEAYDKKMLVYIFVAILRSLGIQCRLVLSFQVEPLRPPDNELCSLSTKSNGAKPGTSKSKDEIEKDDEILKDSEETEISKPKTTGETEKEKSSEPKISERKKLRSKSTNESQEKNTHPRNIKTRSKTANESQLNDESPTSAVKVKEKTTPKLKKETKKVEKTKSKSTTGASAENSKKRRPFSAGDKAQLKSNDRKTVRSYTLRSHKNSPAIPQLDGVNDSTSDDEVFVDCATSDARSSKNNKKLKQKETNTITTRSKYVKIKLKLNSSDSEDDFVPRSPFSKKNKNSPKASPGIAAKKQAKTQQTEKQRTNKKEIAPKLIKSPPSTVKNTAKTRKPTEESDKDSDYIPEPIKRKHRESEDDFVTKLKGKSKKKNNRIKDENKKKQGIDVWAEVFLDNETRWITVDVVNGQIDCITELYTRSTHPVSYIVAWNNDSSLKDVSSRYCQNFNTATRWLRVHPKWWQATLKPFLGPKTALDEKENEDLERQQLEKPLPKTIKEYKNHPLYVLKRHLLKYQAIYPPDAPSLGFVRNEPVYSRQCVFILHPRDIWLKQAKVVKPGEKAYKIVRGRPRWDKYSKSIVTDPEEEVFGPWQIQDYEPPTAENGIVPRNAYGNVELFKPCMLPKKTVHLRLPGLRKIAKRMNIDCAPAFTGFNYSEGWIHPAYDGYVVCEEYADILVAAWELDQDELEKKEQEKIDKRVYDNWKKLIKGLLIRERLKTKYAFGETSKTTSTKRTKKAPTFPIKKRKL